jgi:DNA-binding transcriptional LysR family regulator
MAKYKHLIDVNNLFSLTGAMQMDQFKAVDAFVRAAKLGSFGKAAVELGVTQQQASKSIKQLENYLGVRLFNRTTRSVSLTQDGERFFADADAGLSRLTLAFAAAKTGVDNASGPVRVTAPYALANSLLMALVAEFRLKHPRIVVELISDDHITDLVDQRIDLGIRAGTVQDGRLIARKLVPIQHIVCATPEFLALYGVPKNISDLGRFSCTAFRHIGTGKIVPWEFMHGDQLKYVDVLCSFITNDVEAEANAVLRGMGVGQLASFIAARHIQAGRLKPLFLESMTERYALYLYYASREHLPLRVRLLRDFLIEKLEGNEQLYLTQRTVSGSKRLEKSKAQVPSKKTRSKNA